MSKFSNDDIIPYQSYSKEKEKAFLEQEEHGIMWCVEPNQEYYLIRDIYEKIVFFSIGIYKKVYDKIEVYAKKQVTFADGIPDLPTGTIIKINKATENWYYNKKSFCEVVWFLRIFDYEVVKMGNPALDEIRSSNKYKNQYEKMPNDILNSLGDIELPF